MYTSYFALTKKLLENGYKNLVAISGYLPNFYSVQMQNDKRLTRCIELSPKKEWQEPTIEIEKDSYRSYGRNYSVSE